MITYSVMALSCWSDPTNIHIGAAGLGIVLLSVVISSIWIYVLALITLVIGLRTVRQWTARKIQAKGQAVFITGCDTGAF